MERERTVNKLTQVANDTMGGILNSIEYYVINCLEELDSLFAR